MKIHRGIKIAAISIVSIFLILFTVLVVHIVTAKPVQYDNATLQISRIDFKEPIDSIKAKEIHRNMKSIAGVKNPKLFPEKNVLVYYHDSKVINSQEVFNQLMAKGNYKAERLVIPVNIAAKQVCPVMDQNSFKYKFSRGVKRIFN
ncbi:MAG: hypothetical protein EOO46_13850 [Flavobacterium sp.]|nr:MAG: hypothetical protein EOO46_13850 [Flavobacterium sp.]